MINYNNEAVKCLRRAAALIAALCAWLIAMSTAPGQQSPAKPRRGLDSSPTSIGNLGPAIAAVSVSPASFNPARGEKVTLAYTLLRDARITIKVLDPDRSVVRTLVSNGAARSGPRTQTWDGKDAGGRLVPNEAFEFVIEAVDATGMLTSQDSAATSGGEFGDIRRGSTSRESGTVSYTLSQPSRLLLRAGIPGSALLKTVVDWEPRPAGQQTEYWNGRDEDNLVDVLGLKERSIIISYMTLPDNSVITYGNSAYTYREYVERYAKNRTKVPMPTFRNNRKVSPHYTKDRLKDRGFKLKITFPELDKPGAPVIPTARDRLLVNIEVDPKDLEVVANQQLEVILFTDLQFHSEEERGYLPFRYPLEVADLPAGEHVLTVNVVTFGDQVGIGSRKFKVVK